MDNYSLLPMKLFRQLQLVGGSLLLLLLVAGCVTPPPQPTPAPRLNPSLLESQISVTGSGIPDGMVDVLLDGTRVARGKVTEKGTFDVDVPVLEPGQIITATQTINGQTSAHSLPIIVEKASLTEIEIHPALPLTIDQGQTLPFTVRGLYSNGRIEDPLPGVTWSIENPTVATIDAEGIVTGITAGTATIQAKRDEIQSLSTIMRVKPRPPSITTTLKVGDRIIRGTAEPSAKIKIMINEVPLRTQILADAQGRWQTSDLPPLKEKDQVSSTQVVSGIQSVSSSPVVVGPAILERIAIHPAPSATVEQGQTQEFTASGTFSNGRVEAPLPRVTWSTENPNVATIDAEGIVTGVAAGITAIRASREDMESSQATLTVYPLPPAVTSQLKAGDTAVKGTAAPLANIQLALNDETSGDLVQANEKGEWSIEGLSPLAENDQVTSTQHVNNIESSPSNPVIVGPAVLTQITLLPAPSTTVDLGQSRRFTALGPFSDGRVEDPLPNVTWLSTNPNIARIDAEGMVTGMKAGKTTIQATREGVESSHTSITVKPLPPVVTSSLKAGDTIVAGSASSSAEIQILRNGMRIDTTVLADSQGTWQVNDLQSLSENDQVTALQIVNKVQSDPAKIVKVLPNNPPSFNPIDDQIITVGETLKLTLNAVDPEGDEVSFEAIDQPLPANSFLEKETGLFTFTPSTNQVGETRLNFLASDGYASQQKTITVKVTLPKSLVVLLDNPDGTVGKIQVANAAGMQTLDKAGQAIGIGHSNEPLPEPFLLKNEDIQETFKDVLKANPEEPIKYILYFETDTKLSFESEQQLPEIISSITARTAPDVSIVGHSDRTGSVEYNNQLSLRRATSVRETFVAKGIDPLIMNVTSHGENDPIVETPDGVSEPLNRRVEIIIR